MEGRDDADETAEPGRTLNLRPFAKAVDEPPDKRPPKSKPKHRRRKRKLAALGLVVAILGTTAFTIGSVFSRAFGETPIISRWSGTIGCSIVPRQQDWSEPVANMA